MPNYRYHAPEYDRRGCCYGRSTVSGQPQSRSMSRNPQSQMQNQAQNPQCRTACQMQSQAREQAGSQTQNQRPQAAQSCQTEQEMSCAVRESYDVLAGMPAAMAYVPWQMWGSIFEAEKGFRCGTVFEELNKPFKGAGGGC